ncbi:MAG: murein transglycosylase A [Hyphomicrobium sp.]
MSLQDIRFSPVSFKELPGWQGEKYEEAFAAFYNSSKRLLQRSEENLEPKTPQPILTGCLRCVENYERIKTRDSAKLFFEENFIPHRVLHAQGQGLLTGYYEPCIQGSVTRTDRFAIPILRRPPDLINLVAESERGAFGDALTHARRTADGDTPYSTRAEIENGALGGQGLEFLWLENRVDAFFLHIQGSGLIQLEDGSEIRITYDGKNGHPYTSVGRYLIEAGLFPADQMSLQALKDWLRADEKRGISAMQQNRSYIFFRQLKGEEGLAPLGAMEIPLMPWRSLAIDTLYHAIGTPIYVTVPQWTHEGSSEGFRRLMIGQDVGSAIRGPERGDIFFGTGDKAGSLAGITKHSGNFFVLRTRERA